MASFTQLFLQLLPIVFNVSDLVAIVLDKEARLVDFVHRCLQLSKLSRVEVVEYCDSLDGGEGTDQQAV